MMCLRDSDQCPFCVIRALYPGEGPRSACRAQGPCNE